jgi:CheY-like chemotaxis protein
MFNPFFTIKTAAEGTGLGLSIVRGIVQEHSGKVTFAKRPGGGATFTIELPVEGATAALGSAAETAANARPHAARSLKTDPHSFDRRGVARRKQDSPGRRRAPQSAPQLGGAAQSERILVVENELVVAKLIADVLSEDGYAVDVALDSREGIGLVQRNHYGLVMCDVRMPHLDGPGFERELLRRGTRLEQRLVFVTGDAHAPQTAQFLQQRGGIYVAKPFLVEELRAAVKDALALARNETAAATAGAGGGNNAPRNAGKRSRRV